MNGLDATFVLASVLAAGSSALVVTRRNPIYSAAWMMVALFAIAIIFLVLASPFIAVIQVLLYAGAILVLFVFVIMLLNPGREALTLDRPPAWIRGLGAAFAAALLLVLAGGIFASDLGAVPAFSAQGAAAPPAGFGETEWFGATVYDQYLLVFEMISLLIMAAISAVVVIAKRRLPGE